MASVGPLFPEIGPDRVVVDTSVVSYLLKGHSLAPQYASFLKGKLVGLSFMSLAELYRWPLERGWYVLLLPDDETCQEWARVMARKGRPISVPDAWIAATAIQHQCPLVTHNPRHFQGISGLGIVTADP